MKQHKIFFLIFLLFIFIFNIPYALAKTKQKPVLILSSNDPRITSYDEKIDSYSVFNINSRIYFFIYNPKGFTSDYIKYQIVKQDDKAHVGGYTRTLNKTVRVKDKNSYIDYFVLSQTGKYYIQVFDITNLQQWLAIGAFRVIE